MMLSRKNLKAGVKLKGYPLEEENGNLGFKVGYCEGCNEPLLFRTIDTQDILAKLFYATEKYDKLLEDLKPKFSFKKRLIKWLVGKLGEYPIMIDSPVYN